MYYGLGFGVDVDVGVDVCVAGVFFSEVGREGGVICGF